MMNTPYASTAPQQFQATPQINPQPPQLFGLIIPGREVITNFTPTDHTGTKFTVTLPFPSNIGGSDSSASAVSDLVFFLLPNVPLPAKSCAMLYWSAASNSPIPNNNTEGTTTGFQLLGALTPTKSSGIFRTGWSSHEPLLSLIQSSPSGITITLGVSVEDLENVNNLEISRSGVEDRKSTAKKIALDLFNYLQSFDADGSNGSRPGWMMVPSNVFDRWLQRFEGKLGRDPNFFMKNGDGV